MMTTHKTPRPRKPARPRHPEAAQPLLDATLRSTKRPDALDIEPLLVALPRWRSR